MLPFMLIFVAALGLSLGFTPLARRLALRIGVVDHPGQRKLHAQTMPLLGGLAIWAASGLALLLLSNRFYVSQVISIFVGATLVSFLGMWDDRWHLSPWLKLVGQALAALLLVESGVRVEFLRNDILNVLATVLWVVGVTNSLNLLDNMDGLSGGIAAVAAGFFFLLAVSNGQILVASMAAALLGACAGFLVYNFNPARIFMGDTGSLFIGYVLAVVGIKLRFDNVDTVTWMVPVMVLGLPIFDTMLVIISRLRNGQNPLTTPGKDHVSHRLTRLGLSQREAVMALYLVSGTLGMVSIFLMSANVFEAYLVGGLLVVVALVALVRLESTDLRQPSPSATPPHTL